MDASTLFELLESSYSKSRWHSLRAVLRGLTEEDASWKPPGHKGFQFMDGSIRDIVFHVGADQLVQVSRRFGDGGVTWEALTERFNAEGRGLHPALRLLEEGKTALLVALKSLAEDDLDGKADYGDHSITHREFFLMMIEHNLYHAGQIRYIRNLVDG